MLAVREEGGTKMIFKLAEEANKCVTNNYEEYPNNPKNWDNLGTMVFFSNKIRGDEHHFNNPDEFVKFLEKEKPIYLPVFAYIHGGISLNTVDYDDPWDSGQIGWIFADRKKIMKKYGVKRITKQVKEKVLRALKAEIEIYQEYLNGNVFGFKLEKDGKLIDSCFGFYGCNFKENGMAEYLGKYAYLLDEL